MADTIFLSEINTLTDLTACGHRLAALAAQLALEITDWVVAREPLPPRTRIDALGPHGTPLTDHSELGPPDLLPPLTQTLRTLLGPQLGVLSWGIGVGSYSFQWRARIDIRRDSLAVPEMADSIQIRLHPLLLQRNPNISQRIREITRDTARLLNAVGGYATPNSTNPLNSPHEQRIGRSRKDALHQATTACRGPAWATILSQRHLDRLGGRDHVLHNAPAAIRDDWTTTNRELVYLQLSPYPHDETPTQLHTLRKFLAPVMPTQPRSQAAVAAARS